MNKVRNIIGVLATCVMLISTPSAPSGKTPVDLELVLAVDVSSSMDPDEQLFQRQGYIDAFRSEEVLRAIQSGYFGQIAVTYMEWSGPGNHTVLIPWTIIKDRASANDFAAGLAEALLHNLNSSSISDAILFAKTLFNNQFQGERLTIDVSGDGPNNTGLPVAAARDQVVAEGININGLPLMLRPSDVYGAFQDLDVYYQDCVIGGLQGAFTVPVYTVEQFPEAVRRKLVLEIARQEAPPPLVIPAKATFGTAKTDCMVGEKLLDRHFQIQMRLDPHQ